MVQCDGRKKKATVYVMEVMSRKTNGSFGACVCALCTLECDGAASIRNKQTHFSQAREKTPLTNRRGGLYFIVNFFSAASILLCFALLSLSLSLDLFWLDVFLSERLVHCHGPFFSLEIYFRTHWDVLCILSRMKTLSIICLR